MARLKRFKIATAVGTGCAVLLAALPIGSVGSASAGSIPTVDRFEQLRARDLRVATVAYRLAIANRARCQPVLTPQLGFVLTGIGQYEAADRTAAARAFGLGQHVGVMAVVAGSPAERARLQAGDQIVAIDGKVLMASDAGEAGRASVGSVQRALVAAMRRGVVTLRMASAHGERDVQFAADLGCPSDVELIAGGDVNAWADGSRVMIGDGLLRRCPTDDDLALVIGHEMAHNLLHHRQRLAADGIVVNGLLPLTDTASNKVRATEEEADGLAVELATTAAYDLSGAETFVGGLVTRAATAGATHPELPRRLALLHAAIAATEPGAVATGVSQ